MAQQKKKPRRKLSVRERARRALQAGTPEPRPSRPFVPPQISEAPAGASAQLTADDYRTTSSFRFQLPSRPGKHVMIRRTDLFSLFMADAVPLNLLEIVGDLEKMQDAIEKNPAALAMMSAENKAKVTNAVDRVCVAVVASPMLVHKPDGNPSHLWVGDINLTDKLAIFVAAQYPPPLQPGETEPTPPRLEGDAARTFRGDEQRTDDPAPSNGQSVRAKTKLVDDPVAGKVEYVGA